MCPARNLQDGASSNCPPSGARGRLPDPARTSKYSSGLNPRLSNKAMVRLGIPGFFHVYQEARVVNGLQQKAYIPGFCIPTKHVGFFQAKDELESVCVDTVIGCCHASICSLRWAISAQAPFMLLSGALKAYNHWSCTLSKDAGRPDGFTLPTRHYERESLPWSKSSSTAKPGLQALPRATRREPMPALRRPGGQPHAFFTQKNGFPASKKQIAPGA